MAYTIMKYGSICLSIAWPKELKCLLLQWPCDLGSTPTLVMLLRPWIRHFTIMSAWWLQTSSKLTGKKSESTRKLGKLTTPKWVRIRQKYITTIAFLWQEHKDGTNKQMFPINYNKGHSRIANLPEKLIW